MRDLEAITLRDLYGALGEGTLFATGKGAESPGCLVERAVFGIMAGFFRDAEALLAERLSEITLTDLARAVKRLKKRRKTPLIRHVA